MKISYAITVCNELKEIQRLLDFLLSEKKEHDEIIVLMDTTKATDELVSTLRHYEMHNMDHMTVWADKFEGHFADWKNKLASYCSGNYIFQIDADELPHTDLVKILPLMLEQNSEVDLFFVPRINTVEGLTQEHIIKWRWNVDEKGWVNFPDYQTRIYKKSPEIKWEGKVHERITGTKTFSPLPAEEVWCLYHPKNIEKQEKQNNYYETI
jgi:hypothetical protein